MVCLYVCVVCVHVDRMEAGLAMGVMDFSSMMSKTVLYTMSRAWQVGRAVLRARRLHSSVLAAITDLQEGFVLIYGKVTIATWKGRIEDSHVKPI